MPPESSTRSEPPPEGQQILQGLVKTVTYRDPATLFTVLRLAPEEDSCVPPEGSLFHSERVTAVGRTAEEPDGARVRLIGRWGHHPRHGERFEFDLLELLPPVDRRGLERYLASKAFPGIGPTLAGRIVETLGEATLERIAADPSCLAGIRGLSSEVASELARRVREQQAVHRAYAYLHGLGLGPLQSRAVLSKLGGRAREIIEEDPYQLQRVPGLGFRLADRVALGLGFPEDDPRRLRAALLHVMESAANDGQSLLPLGEAQSRTRRELRSSVDEEAFGSAALALAQSGEIVFDRSFLPEEAPPNDPKAALYLPWLHASEVGLTREILRLALEETPPLATAEDLARGERAGGIELHPDQRRAVLALLSAPVGLLTGGPGVGKTTIVRLIANLAQAAGARLKLASPTGRAAKRLAEATGRPASTIHRLLRYDPETGGFSQGSDRPLHADLVVIDEISMLDVVLAYNLARAIETGSRLILVGDPDQLPSVGPGNVLSDLLTSGCIPVARLRRIYRQERGSLIIENAHRVLSGELPTLPPRGAKDADFYYFPCEDPARTADLLVDVVTQRIPETFGFDWTRDVQVIAPMYRGECGVDLLNERLREAQGIGGREVVRGDRVWRLGDRVIQTKNDYEREVFNGDMGRITRISEEGEVTVSFPEQEVVYSGAAIADLQPAFAITVHRSQGGEFPCVVIPLVNQHAVMLRRNLFYTAITRARRLVVLVGSRRAMALAVRNAERGQRESLLAARLQRAFGAE